MATEDPDLATEAEGFNPSWASYATCVFHLT